QEGPMPDYSWPAADKRQHIGKRMSRLDGPFKSTGRAKYTYDINRPGMLFSRPLRCPYSHARLVSIDTSEAERMPGVKGVRVTKQPGDEILWSLDAVAYVAAETEEQAEDAVRKIAVKFEPLAHVVKERNLSEVSGRAKPEDEQKTGDPDK